MGSMRKWVDKQEYFVWLRSKWFLMLMRAYPDRFEDLKNFSEYVWDYRGFSDKYIISADFIFRVAIKGEQKPAYAEKDLVGASQLYAESKKFILRWMESVGVDESQQCFEWIARSAIDLSRIDVFVPTMENVYFPVLIAHQYTEYNSRKEAGEWVKEDTDGLVEEFYVHPNSPNRPTLPLYKGEGKQAYKKMCMLLIDEYLKKTDDFYNIQGDLVKNTHRPELSKHLKWLMWAVVEKMDDAAIASRETKESSLENGVEEKTVAIALRGKTRGTAHMIGFVKKD